MKFGVREIADVVFKAKSDIKIGKTLFRAGQPVLYIDTAKTSTVEGSSTSVYATGGKGNTRLITWSGEKTLTFTVEDALLSPIGFTILSGAGLFNGSVKTSEVHVHKTYSTTVQTGGIIDLSAALGGNDICTTAPIFAVEAEKDGSVTGEVLQDLKVAADGKSLEGATAEAGTQVFVDFYVIKKATDVNELQITADDLSGNYYVEASTLFRRQSDGKDLPAELTIPNVKIQSNFTFTMAGSGDPSTFTFTMDAMPDYTMFDKSQKVLCAIQIVDESADNAAEIDSVFPHGDEIIDEAGADSTTRAIAIQAEDPAETILGKAVSALQSDVQVNGNVVSGTLNQINGWTGFSSDPTKQDGYFLAFKLADECDETELKFEVIGGDSEGNPVAFDADKNAVILVKNNKQKIKITQTQASGETHSKVFSLSGLVLA